MAHTLYSLPSLDFSVGGTTKAIVAAFPSDWAGDSYGLCELAPLLNLSSDTIAVPFELRASVDVLASSEPVRTVFRIDESYVKAWLGSWLALKAGYFRVGSVAAEFFPQSAFFGSYDPLAFLERGASLVPRGNELLAETSFFYNHVRATVRVAPFVPSLALPDLSSPWFLMRDIPESATIGGSTYTLGNLAYQEGADTSLFSPSLAYSVTVGFSTSNLDLDAHFFHGLERQPLLTVAVEDMPTSYTYDVILKTNRAIIDVLALSATYVTDSLRFWFESSFTFNASVVSGSIDFTGIYLDPTTFKATSLAPAIASDRLGITVGASWRHVVGKTILNAMTECVWTVLFSDAILPRDPYLSKAAVAGFSVMDNAEKFGATCFAMVSLSDWSFALKPSLSLNFGANNSLEVGMPLFFGESSTELGAYSGRRYIFVTLVHRY